MTLLDDLTASGHHIATDLSPSVVGVGRRGTGVVVADGFVATNAHNLGHGRRGHGRAEGGPDQIRVTFADGRTADATVRAVDVDGDLAVLEVDTSGVAPVRWADDPPEPGDAVFAVANPGGRGIRLSFGIVSGVGREFRGPRGRRIAGSVEHTAPLARGSSGGPLVDHEGRVVGINTHRLDDGFYLALPVGDRLRRAIDDLTAGAVPNRRSLGVAVVPPRIARRMRAAVGLPERDGLLVRAVDPDGPAAAADVRDGDLIVTAGGRAAASIDDLHDVLDGWAEPTIELGIVRGTTEIAATLEFD